MNPPDRVRVLRASSRTFSLSAAALLLFAASAFAQSEDELMALPECPALAAGSSHKVFATVYDDGLACPDCARPHVIVNDTDNGSEYAHLATDIGGEHHKCELDKPCRICFKPGDASQCIVEIYKGAGPIKGRFDFPVVWYKRNCKQQGLPEAMAKMCEEIEVAARNYTEGRKNCFENKKDPTCAKIMSEAEKRREADEIVYHQCKKSIDKYLKANATEFDKCQAMISSKIKADVKELSGCLERTKKWGGRTESKIYWALAAYNSGAGSHSNKRGDSCIYSYEKKMFPFKQKGPDGKDCRKMRGWNLLLPSACPAKSYPGENGLNCCTGDPYFVGALGNDCQIFYPPSKSN